MKYDLIICRKSKTSDQTLLHHFVEDFKAQKVDECAWQFETDHPFEGIEHSANQYLDKDFRYFIVALDGSEHKPIPNIYSTNDKTIRFYIGALKGKGAEDRYSIYIGSQLHFARHEHLLEKKEDAQFDE